MVEELSVLIGGQAGDGIRQTGVIIANLFNKMGYWTFVYDDYQSLIRGGHNFAIVRASRRKVQAHRDRVEILVALNQESVEKHSWRLGERSLVVFDSGSVKAEGLGIPMAEMAKRRGLPLIMRNSVAVGALASMLGVEFSLVESVVRRAISRNVEENLELAREGYASTGKYAGMFKLDVLGSPPGYLVTGNEALSLGAVKAGMKLYVAYPMTPSSSILHYLAANEDKFGIVVIHPENEIAVIGIAEGAAYAGARVAVGTSGGGFALMVEHLSLAGQAEIPVVIFLAQRPGPATGVPTYTEQGDLFFAIFAGHGEFPRVVLAPGDADEAFQLSGEAMNLAWKFQVPVIVLSDKHLSESVYTAIVDEGSVKVEQEKLWDGTGEYKRYLFTEDGVSPLAFPGTPGAIVKANSYEHDEYGLTTEDPVLVARGHEKRLRKMKAIESELREKPCVKTYGNEGSETVLVTWGSTKGVVVEVAERLGLYVVQPLCLYPLPTWELKKLIDPGRRIVSVEVNSTGQLATWLSYNGFRVDGRILKYNGRPFSVEELEERLLRGGAA
ncbi:2-oxoacid:acceptor oxidoreductase subunit alpha [Thermofilum pendens]|uniref:2-oxoacid oxidoreductase (ferredoxin) n=1 Tax=Thermofilum pendens (strain DSM 2475 / Hrk 5) TaxID=368408 RepID=A1S073_THEPD|nr:2-oxoacid:acceptor oxidoreductase subunit alpha [Thermofilum pendens]ABL78853.1 pyruvate flavodoxin/ferredoxin oxidoreductase domain protein [Thermofilum pendens Hrk 5]